MYSSSGDVSGDVLASSSLVPHDELGGVSAYDELDRVRQDVQLLLGGQPQQRERVLLPHTLHELFVLLTSDRLSDVWAFS